MIVTSGILAGADTATIRSFVAGALRAVRVRGDRGRSYFLLARYLDDCGGHLAIFGGNVIARLCLYGNVGGLLSRGLARGLDKGVRA